MYVNTTSYNLTAVGGEAFYGTDNFMRFLFGAVDKVCAIRQYIPI